MNEHTWNLQSLQEHHHWLRRLAQQLVRDPDAAEDLAQDTWLTALSLHRNVPAESTRGWLAGIMRNLARNAWRTNSRRLARERAVALDAEAPTAPTSALETLEQGRALMDHVLGMEPKSRDVLIHLYFHGKTSVEAGHALGLSSSAIRNQHRQALVLLRDRLDRENRGDRRAWTLSLGAFARPGVKASRLPWALAAGMGALVVGAGWMASTTLRRTMEPRPLAMIDPSGGPEASPLTVLEPANTANRELLPAATAVESATKTSAAPAPGATQESKQTSKTRRVLRGSIGNMELAQEGRVQAVFVVPKTPEAHDFDVSQIEFVEEDGSFELSFADTRAGRLVLYDQGSRLISVDVPAGDSPEPYAVEFPEGQSISGSISVPDRAAQGVVVLRGPSSNRAILNSFLQAEPFAWTEQAVVRNSARTRVRKDGSFDFSGLMQTEYRIHFEPSPTISPEEVELASTIHGGYAFMSRDYQSVVLDEPTGTTVACPSNGIELKPELVMHNLYLVHQGRIISKAQYQIGTESNQFFKVQEGILSCLFRPDSTNFLSVVTTGYMPKVISFPLASNTSYSIVELERNPAIKRFYMVIDGYRPQNASIGFEYPPNHPMHSGSLHLSSTLPTSTLEMFDETKGEGDFVVRTDPFAQGDDPWVVPFRIPTSELKEGQTVNANLELGGRFALDFSSAPLLGESWNLEYRSGEGPWKHPGAYTPKGNLKEFVTPLSAGTYELRISTVSRKALDPELRLECTIRVKELSTVQVIQK